jgi:hypothetical protein
MRSLLNKLSGGDRRSIGRCDEVVAQVLREPSLFAVLIAGLDADDPVVCMRVADALEKISLQHPDWLWPYKQTCWNWPDSAHK